MEYKEFLNIINEIQVGEAVYFKPAKPEVLNAYDPKIKNDLFQITIEPDGSYMLNYMTLMKVMNIEKIPLGKMFQDKNWIDYMQFDMMADYNEWQESLAKK